MDTKDRIRLVMEDQHMTQQVFADFIQQAPATLSSIFTGRTRPTLNVIEAIKKKLPNISIDWLMFGAGDMYMSNSDVTEQHSMPAENVSEPMINFDSSVSQSPPLSSSRPIIEHGVRNTPLNHVREEFKIIDKIPRKVTEIRVYYDDQTYETFVPAKSK